MATTGSHLSKAMHAPTLEARMADAKANEEHAPHRYLTMASGIPGERDFSPPRQVELGPPPVSRRSASPPGEGDYFTAPATRQGQPFAPPILLAYTSRYGSLPAER